MQLGECSTLQPLAVDGWVGVQSMLGKKYLGKVLCNSALLFCSRARIIFYLINLAVEFCCPFLALDTDELPLRLY